MAKASAEVRSLARAHTETAVSTLRGICTSKKAPASARVAAAEALLNRGWGKPKEFHELDVSDQLAELLKAIDGRGQLRIGG